MWDLQTKNKVYHQSYGGKENSFIKMKTLNDSGELYSVSYFDNGLFYLSVFDDEMEIQNVCFNELLDLSIHTRVNEDFYDPYTASTFISESEIFVVIFDAFAHKHVHFIWNINQQKSMKEVVRLGTQWALLSNSKKNFPQRVFFDQKTDTVHIIYR